VTLNKKQKVTQLDGDYYVGAHTLYKNLFLHMLVLQIHSLSARLTYTAYRLSFWGRKPNIVGFETNEILLTSCEFLVPSFYFVNLFQNTRWSKVRETRCEEDAITGKPTLITSNPFATNNTSTATVRTSEVRATQMSFRAGFRFSVLSQLR
jgi:hypothetical protein